MEQSKLTDTKKKRNKSTTVTLKKASESDVNVFENNEIPQYQYEAVRKLREDYNINDKEFYGQYLRAAVQAEETGHTKILESIIESIKDIEENVQLTEYTKDKPDTTVTQVSFRSAWHPDNENISRKDVEHDWFKAAIKVREYIGTKIGLFLSNFAYSLVMAVENDDVGYLDELVDAISPKDKEVTVKSQ